MRLLIGKNDKGSVTLEMTIFLPIFMFIFIFIFGLFPIVAARNKITHTLVQSTKSLSMDSYITENVNSLYKDSTFWGGFSDAVIGLFRLKNAEEDKYFSSQNDWYENKENPKSLKKGESPNEIARLRFIGFLSGGNESEADEKLKNLGVIDGLTGMQFEVEVEDEDVTVTIKYKLKYIIDFYNMGELPMEQSMTSRLWK